MNMPLYDSNDNLIATATDAVFYHNDGYGIAIVGSVQVRFVPCDTETCNLDPFYAGYVFAEDIHLLSNQQERSRQC